MSDATNDTLDEIVSNLWEHAIDAPWFANITEHAQRLKLKEWLVESGVQELIESYDALESDLLRLAGPPCDNPPCKRARAVEHRISINGGDGSKYLTAVAPGVEVLFGHPPSPAIEAWLRARGAK
jgi:hypothetical protein